MLKIFLFYAKTAIIKGGRKKMQKKNLFDAREKQQGMSEG